MFARKLPHKWGHWEFNDTWIKAGRVRCQTCAAVENIKDKLNRCQRESVCYRRSIGAHLFLLHSKLCVKGKMMRADWFALEENYFQQMFKEAQTENGGHNKSAEPSLALSICMLQHPSAAVPALPHLYLSLSETFFSPDSIFLPTLWAFLMALLFI